LKNSVIKNVTSNRLENDPLGYHIFYILNFSKCSKCFENVQNVLKNSVIKNVTSNRLENDPLGYHIFYILNFSKYFQKKVVSKNY